MIKFSCRKIIFIVPYVFVLLSCGTTDMYMKNVSFDKKPNKIVLGFIEKRTLSIEPHVEDTVRNALEFKLNEKGYSTFMWDGKNRNPSIDEIQKIISANTAELFIQGMIVENTTNDALEPKNVSMLSVSIYAANGELISQIRETSDDDIAQIKIMNEMISDIVNVFDKKINTNLKR